MWLIDAYNVMGVMMPVELAGMNEGGLCRALERAGLTRPRGRSAAVVCDGLVKPGGAAVSPVVSVELIYSGPRRSADDVIMEMVGKSSTPRRLTVVSNDRVIQAAARKRKARVMASESLIQSLADRLARGGVASGGAGDEGASGKKSEGIPPCEVQEWLEEFGLDEY